MAVLVLTQPLLACLHAQMTTHPPAQGVEPPVVPDKVTARPISPIETWHPGHTSYERVTYLDNHQAEAALQNRLSASLLGRSSMADQDQSRAVLMSREKFSEKRQPLSDNSLLQIKNTSLQNWAARETFGKYPVTPGLRVDFDFIVTGNARILIEQYDSEGGPLGTQLVKNSDHRKKLINHSFIAGSDTASVAVTIIAPPKSTVEINDLLISTVTRNN